jgi:PAS domain S-box-containing protein
MNRKPGYDELQQRVEELEKRALERKQVEDALYESEERYRRITDATTDYIYTVRIEDGHPAETIHGPTCVAVTGYTVEDFEANPYLWIQMVHEEDRKAVEEHASQTVSGVKVPPLEHRIVRKDGVVRWVRNTRVPHYDSQGKLLSYDGLLQDITGRRLAEEALRESEAKYRAIFENTGTATIIGDEDTTILMANSQFVELSGYAKEEVEGIKSWTEFVVEDDLESVKGYHGLRRVDANAAPRNHEFRFIDRHGSVKHIFATVAMIPETPMGVASFSDITEEKRKGEELRRINEELNNFVHLVSHDLKTPIVSIEGFSARLLKSHQATSGEKDLEYLRHINTSARRIRLLVSDLLSLSRIGRVVPTFSDVSLLNMMSDLALSLQDRLEESGTGLVVTQNLPTISCDAERIRQVFQNLLVNAVKFVRGTKHPKIEVGYEDLADFHQFYVRDNGIGIHPKYHLKIFERFHRLGEIEDPEGTGLGLAIVERAVNDHGGRVWVDSEQGKGATFYFTLLKKPDAVRHPLDP